VIILYKKGFTLVELLVVLIIIGILVALILPNALRAVRQANTKECASNIRSLDTAVQMYYTENRSWPTAIADLAPYLENNTVPTCPFGTAYSLIDDASGGKRVDKDAHFSTWPTQHQ
jgi:general secretion pathway protein G